MLRAIVFDFDGVLANSEPLHFTAFRDTLAERHVALTEQEYYASYLGYDDVQFFRTVGSDRGLSWDAPAVAALVSRKAAVFERLEHDQSILFPGARDVILAASAALPIAIASGARGDEVRRVLARENLSSCFTAIVAAEDTPASKPAPDPYQRALALLTSSRGEALAAGDCVAIEDSRWGLESARAAGMKTVAVMSSYPASELRSADLIIPSLLEFDLRALADLCR